MPLTLDANSTSTPDLSDPADVAHLFGPRNEQRLSRRTRIELLLRRAQYLPLTDQRLLKMVLAKGMNFRDLAYATQTSHSRLRRRTTRLMRHLTDPLFLWTLAHRDVLPAHLRDTARHVVLGGLSLRTTARLTGRSLHALRSELTQLRALAQRRHP